MRWESEAYCDDCHLCSSLPNIAVDGRTRVALHGRAGRALRGVVQIDGVEAFAALGLPSSDKGLTRVVPSTVGGIQASRVESTENKTISCAASIDSDALT